MGSTLSVRNQVFVLVSIRLHQNDNSGLVPCQANAPLRPIRLAVFFSVKHALIENRIALSQIARMFADVELSLGGVIAHVLFIVYTFNRGCNAIAEQANAASARAACINWFWAHRRVADLRR